MKPVLTFILLLLCASANAATYYVDYVSGLDSANGTSKSTPWQHHPYMTNAWTGSYIHSPGDAFIFKGSTTWPNTCFSKTGMFIPHGGASGAVDYYGVDQTWFNGGSWTRPKFDGQFISGNIIVLNSSDSTGSGGVNWVTIDSLEMCDVQRYDSTGYAVFSCGFCCNCTFTNLFIHDWFFPAANGNGTGQDNAPGGYHGFYSSGIYPTNVFLLGSEIENAAQGPSNMWNGFCVAGCGVISNCLVHDNGGTVDYAIELLNSRVWDSGYPYTNYDQSFHIDTYYMDVPGGNGPLGFPPLICSGNFIWNEGGQNAGLVYPNTDISDCYIYNNVLFGVVSTSPIFCDTAGQGAIPAGGIYKSVYEYNNTVICSSSSMNHIATRTNPSAPFENLIFNNFFCSNNFVSGSSVGLAIGDAPLATWTVSHGTNGNLLLPNNGYAAYGYMSNSPSLIYNPPNAFSPTVGSGANLSALNLFSTDILGVSRPSVGAWDIGAYQFPGGGRPVSSLSLGGGGSILVSGGGQIIVK